MAASSSASTLWDDVAHVAPGGSLLLLLRSWKPWLKSTKYFPIKKFTNQDVGPDISMVNEYTCSERRAYDCSLGMALKNQKSCMAAIIGSASLTTSCHTSHCQTAHSKIFPLIIALAKCPKIVFCY